MPASTYGRQVVLPLTNKSGGSVAAGDVVVIDTTNNDAFTTDTAGAFVGTVGIAQETIASNASGRVLTAGYAALVNVNASVTRGNYGKTYTVAKQATDAGSSRGVGTFCQFLTGGTTPDAVMWPVDLLGSSLTNPMTGVGDLIRGGASGAPTRLAPSVAGKILTDGGAGVTPAWGQGPLTTTGDLLIGGAATPTRLAAVATGQVLTSAGTSTAPAWAYPPGYQLSYVEFTANVSITHTTEGASDTIVTAASVTYDGTAVWIEGWAPFATASVGGTRLVIGVLWDDTAGASIGKAPVQSDVSATVDEYTGAFWFRRRITPAAGARVYSWRAFATIATATVAAGAGGVGNYMPGYILITKA